MARVRGIRSVKVVPWPGVERMSILPRNLVMFFATTSMPTPRPEMLVTTAAVEKPGWRIRLSNSFSSGTSPGLTSPFWIAFSRMRSRLRPAPSSSTSITMLPLL